MRASPTSNRAALTLIEVLAVIAIIGILAAPLLPAVGIAQVAALITEQSNSAAAGPSTSD